MAQYDPLGRGSEALTVTDPLIEVDADDSVFVNVAVRVECRAVLLNVGNILDENVVLECYRSMRL